MIIRVKTFYISYYPRADLAFFLERGGSITEKGVQKARGSWGMPPGKMLEILIANGAF